MAIGWNRPDSAGPTEDASFFLGGFSIDRAMVSTAVSPQLGWGIMGWDQGVAVATCRRRAGVYYLDSFTDARLCADFFRWAVWLGENQFDVVETIKATFKHLLDTGGLPIETIDEMMSLEHSKIGTALAD